MSSGFEANPVRLVTHTERRAVLARLSHIARRADLQGRRGWGGERGTRIGMTPRRHVADLRDRHSSSRWATAGQLGVEAAWFVGAV
jgi:hypothetical protein